LCFCRNKNDFVKLQICGINEKNGEKYRFLLINCQKSTILRLAFFGFRESPFLLRLEEESIKKVKKNFFIEKGLTQ
jgi:hypothetical protein